MIKNYIKVAWRNLIRNGASSSINVGGLAVGMAVAMLIGLWVWDELAFDKYIQEKGYSEIKSLVAFSGKVIDPDIPGSEYTESGWARANPLHPGQSLM